MRILLSGGGTAGHINPAVAIAKYALGADRKNEILFVGTKDGMESTLIPKEGFDIEFVNVEGLSLKPSVKSAVSAVKMAAGIVKSVGIVKKFKPDIVVGTGGYVCVPAVMAAHLCRIPSVIHEQNVFPGSAVKFLADKADVTAISFDESRKYIKKARELLLTGNPIRPAILKTDYHTARKKLGIGSKKLVVSFGGSLGAMRINDVMIDFIEKNASNGDMMIYFGTGRRDYDRCAAELEKRSVRTGGSVKLLPYIENMDDVMNAADLIICRSGAITLAEICAIGRPSVLIPSPNVTNNHQYYNAKALSDFGAAITVCEKDFDVNSLAKAVYSVIYDEGKAARMAQKAKEMGISDASEKLYKRMTQLVNKSL